MSLFGMKTTGQSTGGTTTSPYGGAKSLLDMALKRSGSLYKTGALAPSAPTNPWQKQGLAGMMSTARSGIPQMNEAIGTYRGFANGAGDIGTGNQQSIFDWLTPTMNGSMIGGDDPNFERIVDSSTERASTAAKMMAGSRGRYGSDYAADSVARAVGDTEASLRYQNREAQLARQMDALGLGLNTANSMTAVQGGNADRRMTAAGAIPGMIQGKAGLYDMMRDAGDMRQADQIGQRGVPAYNLQALLQSLGVATPYASTQQQTSYQEPRNPLGKIFGGGLSLLSMLA